MAIHNEIGNLYRPVQPTIRQQEGEVVYFELPPDSRLRNFIHCYWELKTKSEMQSHFFYNVVSDGCVDIIIDMNRPDQTAVMGFCKEHAEFELKEQFRYVGVRFLPAAFFQMFRVDASELSHRVTGLELIAKSTSGFISDFITPGQSFGEVKGLLDAHFGKIVGNMCFNADIRFYGALSIILLNKGTLNIERDLDTGISSRQLRRLFELYVGDSAKVFSKVVRFQAILNSRPTGKCSREDMLFYELNFHDQSHFIRDFRAMYGLTPGRAFER